QQRAAEHRQVGDEVDPAQVVGRKIRLEVVAAELFEVGREHDLVAVDKIRPRILDGLHTGKQGVGVQHVVVVQQRQVGPGGGGKPRRGVGGDAAVFDFVVQDAPVLRGQFLGQRAG